MYIKVLCVAMCTRCLPTVYVDAYGIIALPLRINPILNVLCGIIQQHTQYEQLQTDIFRVKAFYGKGFTKNRIRKYVLYGKRYHLNTIDVFC